ncbi:MAG: DUF3137 domain-containing protein [Alphaproteobacteria bacterium]|nr:DUF3137 domain-containing protein [Alphaproteobacteria bacterium]
MLCDSLFTKYRADFEEYYYQKIWPKLIEMEEKRLRQLYRFWILFFIMCCALPCFIIYMWGEWLYVAFTQCSGKELEGIIKLGLLLIALIVSIVGYPIVCYKSDVKNAIIKDFINFFGSFDHNIFSKIHDETIKKSLLFNSYNRHYGDDYFYGKYRNVDMVISEEELIFKRNKGQNTVFDGVLILLKFPKNFLGQTVVFKDWGYFNCFHKTAKHFENVKLEDIIFEKEFEVFATDQIEARTLLTTAFMERILKVRDIFHGKKIQFSFFDNHLLIAIHTSTDMFEPSSLFKCSTDRRPINNVFEQFLAVFAIIEFLKLTQQ